MPWPCTALLIKVETQEVGAFVNCSVARQGRGPWCWLLVGSWHMAKGHVRIGSGLPKFVKTSGSSLKNLNFCSNSVFFHLLVTSGILETSGTKKRRWNITERLGAVVNAIFRYTYYNILINSQGPDLLHAQGEQKLLQKWWCMEWENTRQQYLKDWIPDSGVQPKAATHHIPSWISVSFWYLASWYHEIAIHTMNVALQHQQFFFSVLCLAYI